MRSFSRNWIKGKTMLSAIWLASSEWSEFSWMEKTNDTKISSTAQGQKQKCTLAKHLEGFQFIRRCTWHFLPVTPAAFWKVNFSVKWVHNCRQCLCYIIWNRAFHDENNKNLLLTLILEAGPHIAHTGESCCNTLCLSTSYIPKQQADIRFNLND